MIVKIIGVRQINIDPRYDKIHYLTWEEYEKDFMNDDRFTAGNVWINIPERYSPKQEKNGVMLEYCGKKYNLSDVLMSVPKDKGGDFYPYLLFLESDEFGNREVIGSDEVFIPLSFCCDERNIDFIKD